MPDLFLQVTEWPGIDMMASMHDGALLPPTLPAVHVDSKCSLRVS